VAHFSISLPLAGCLEPLLRVRVDECGTMILRSAAILTPDRSCAGAQKTLGQGGSRRAVGGLMATAMKVRGFAGAIVDASIRDLPQIQRIQFPVYGRGVSPGTTVGHYRCVGVNIPVTCAGVTVRPKDIITADEDGVVVVPLEKAAEVLKKAQDLDNTEHSMYPFIERFKSLTDAIAKFGRL